MGDTIVVTTARDLADAMVEVETAGGTWQVAGVPSPRPDAATLVLGGSMADVTALGDGLVEVGGGVTLSSLSQYVQSQVGVAPGWPLGGHVTVAGALAAATDTPPAVAAIISAMSKAVVEVEVMRSTTRAAEVWSRSMLWQHGSAVGLPDDAVVVSVTASVAAAASAVTTQPGPGGIDPGLGEGAVGG